MPLPRILQPIGILVLGQRILAIQGKRKRLCRRAGVLGGEVDRAAGEVEPRPRTGLSAETLVERPVG